MSSSGLSQRTLIHLYADGRVETREDCVAVEAPLELRIAGDPLAVTMRTPGHDHLLALGFLLAEGIIEGVLDVGTVQHCGRTDDPSYGSSLDLVPAPGLDWDVERVRTARRGTLTTSACGVCGRQSVDDLLALTGVLEDSLRVLPSLVTGAPDQLRAHQVNFRQTGGTHAAAALAADGTVLAAFEDVGRHNAVDKVVGALLLGRNVGRSRDPAKALPALLMVSGRTSFEILQKAARARIPIVASVSAPSSLAVEVATRTGITLCAFVRDGAFNIHSHPRRLIEAALP